MKSRQERVRASRCIPIAAPPRRLASALLAAVLCVPAGAADDQAGGLGLEAALERALSRNLQLEAFGPRHAEQRGRLEQSGLLPNPQLGLLVENIAGQGEFEGTDSAETTITLGWAIEPGLRGRRVGVAEERSARTRLEERILRIEVAAETAQRFLSCLESQAHLDAASAAVALAERTVADVERRVRAGRAPDAELMRARAELATERLARDDVTHQQSVAYHRLAAQWGDTTPDFSRVDGVLLDLPTVETFDDVAARIDENPEIARLASEQRVAEAQLRLAKAKRWPTVTPTIAARRFERSDDWALVAGVTLPFPIFDRNQGAVAASRAALARTRADAETERVRVHTTLFEIYEELQHSIHRAEVLRDEVVPRLQETMTETRRGYETGRYSYLELRTIQSDLLAAERARVEASTAAHRLVITLERLTGERIAK